MKLLITTTFVVAIAAANVLAECGDADKKALKAFDHAWSVAGQNGDRNTLMTIYADDYVGFPNMESKMTAIENTMSTFEANKANPSAAAQTKYDNYMISCTPVSATIIHRNSTSSGDGTVTYSRSAHFLEKRGGKWQVVSNAGGSLTDSGVIWYLEQEWNDALMNKDKAWFENNFASDFTGVSGTSGQLMNKAQEIADSTSPGTMFDLVETTDVNVRVDGDAAIVTGVFHIKGKDAKGAAFDQRFRYTDVWIKRSGRWVVWASQGTPIK